MQNGIETSLNRSYDTRFSRGIFWLQGNLSFRAWLFQNLVEKKLQNIPLTGDGVIVDYWSNAGYKTPSLLRTFHDRIIIAIDNHLPSVKIGKQRFSRESRVDFRHGNVLQLWELVTEQIALIFASQIFHHFDKDTRSEALRTTYQSLVPWGYLVVSDTFFDEDSWIGKKLQTFYKRLTQSNAYYNISPSQMRKEAEGYGYIVIKQEDILAMFNLGYYPASMLVFQKPE